MKSMFSLRSTAASLAIGISASLAASSAMADARVEALYHNCVICHGEKAEGIPLQLAPALSSLSEKYIVEQLKKFKSGIRGTHEKDVAGLKMMPMAQVMKDEADMAAVAAHIKTFPSTKKEPTLEGGDAAAGQAGYMTCMACHGSDGKGMGALNSPSLIHQYDWYLLTQLQYFKSRVRGGNPQDTGGAQMFPFASMLADEQAQKNIIAYIQSLSK